jgi:hypothetical protein
MIEFKITERSHRFHLGYGDYQVFLTGGYGLENFEYVQVRLWEVDSGKEIALKEYGLKPRDMIHGRRAIGCYSFWIDRRTEYEIEFTNFGLLEMRYSALFIQNLLFPTKVELDAISVVIQ